MARLCAASAILGTIVGLSAVGAAQPALTCKPVERYGVKGCEILPDQTCPPGYHKQAVGPSDPRMKGPTFLMCVADEPPPKQQPTNPPPRPPKTNR